MDFLNKAWAQLSELFRSMTPGARITAALLLAVVVVSLGYLFKYQATSPNSYLLGGQHFTPPEIDAMVAAFAKKNLNGYEIEGGRIRVPHTQRNLYVGAIADANALPTHPWSATNEADKASSPFESREQREYRIKVAKEKELSLDISSMTGIESARVTYDTEIKPGLVKEKLTRAAVRVKPRGSETLREEQVLAIRRLVAGSFADLPPERVTVADLNGGKTYFGNPDGQGSALDDVYATRKRMYEQLWTAKIADALSYIPGVNVGVNVELDKTRESHEEAITHEAGKTLLPYQTTEKTTTRNMDGSVPAGRPGPLAQAANQPTALNSQRVKGSHEEEEKSEQQAINAVPARRTAKETVGLTPERVKVTVGIPVSYFKKVWLEQNPPEPGAQAKTPDAKDLDKIGAQVLASATKQVANLLPKPEGVADTTELVAVNPIQPITPEALPEPKVQEKALSWLAESWRTVGLILLGLVSLLMLRSMVRTAPAAKQSPALGAATPSAASAEEGETEENKAAEAETASRLKRFRKPGTSLRDELSQLVTEDPDTAANVLRAWIGNAT